MFAGHINLLGGPHVARGPDVAQAWSNAMMYYEIAGRKYQKKEKLCINEEKVG